MPNLTDEFLAGLERKVVTRHAMSDGRNVTFTICGDGGWCADDDDVTCPDCRAILDGRAERLPDEWGM